MFGATIQQKRLLMTSVPAKHYLKSSQPAPLYTRVPPPSDYARGYHPHQLASSDRREVRSGGLRRKLVRSKREETES